MICGINFKDYYKILINFTELDNIELINHQYSELMIHNY